jgi:hypothetical protein
LSLSQTKKWMRTAFYQNREKRFEAVGFGYNLLSRILLSRIGCGPEINELFRYSFR